VIRRNSLAEDGKGVSADSRQWMAGSAMIDSVLIELGDEGQEVTAPDEETLKKMTFAW
jgi:hypothetical protein